MEEFKAQAGVDFTHIPFKGAGQAVPAPLTGEVPIAFIGYPTIGLQTSAGLSKTLVTLFQQTFARALREPGIAERMANPGMVLMENGTDNYLQFMKDEALRYATAAKAAGIKIE